MLPHSTCSEGVFTVFEVHPRTIYIDVGLLRGVYRSHNDARRERFARVERGLLGYHKRVELVHPYIFHIDVGH